MSTNKPSAQNVSRNNRVEWADHRPLNESVLMSIAEEFFPELFNRKDEIAAQPRVLKLSDAFENNIKKNSSDIDPSVLSQNDYLQAIFDIAKEASEVSPDVKIEPLPLPFSDPIRSFDPAFSLAACKNKIEDTELIFSPVVVKEQAVAPEQIGSELATYESHFDVDAIRKDFPILTEKVNGKNLVWLDNAATTQKPQCVIDRLNYFYEHENSNVHRAAHTLAARTTDAYEAARDKIKTFLNASSSNEIVFVRGTTEAINLVAQTVGRSFRKDDEIIISYLEHHANIVPWQMLCAQTGARLKVIPVDESGQVLLSEYEKLFSSKTRIVAFTHISNAIGTITPVAEMVSMAHRHGTRVLVDGAQAVAHIKIDVQALDTDFYVFSGHKLFAPPGIGVLYAKAGLLEEMPPYQGGGNMIRDVTFERTVYQSPPHRFEAGTGSIADAIALGAAIDYVSKLGFNRIFQYEHQLFQYGIESLERINGLSIIGTTQQKASILSFVLKGFATQDVGKALNKEGIAVRTGHHCAQPILRRFGLESTVRPSLAFYNTHEEIDCLASVISNLIKTQAGL